MGWATGPALWVRQCRVLVRLHNALATSVAATVPPAPLRRRISSVARCPRPRTVSWGCRHHLQRQHLPRRRQLPRHFRRWRRRLRRLLLRPWGLAWSVTRCTVLAPQLCVRATSAVLMDPLVPPPRTPSRNVRSPKLWIARRLELSLYRIVENGLWPVPAGLEQRPPKLPRADEQRG